MSQQILLLKKSDLSDIILFRNQYQRRECMKFQVRIKDTMSDKPASRLYDTLKEAENKLSEVRREIRETWATPDVSAAYIFVNQN